MASLDSDVNMVPAGEPSAPSSSSAKKAKRFEVKKWSAVALWAWGNRRTVSLLIPSGIMIVRLYPFL